ncbi:MAG: LysR family transcriptional regulator [Pseudomonadota bacterium]
MSDFDVMKLRQLDLSVLLIFLGLLRHQKASAVAAEMGLTQSAVSHALGRLRAVFDDPLFLRKPHGMEPTAVARALEPQVLTAVRALDAALKPDAAFDPSQSKAIVRISALDYELSTLFPDLLTRMRAAAPGVRLAVQSLNRREAMAALESGAIDLAVGYFWNAPASVLLDPLLEEHYQVVARKGHPTMALMPDLAAFVRAKHLLVSPSGELNGIVDDVLRRAGERRDVVASVPQFLSALAMLAETDLIATVPERLARRHGEAFGLAMAAPPLAIRSFTSSVARHRRDEKNPLHLWLIDQFRAIAPV